MTVQERTLSACPRDNLVTVHVVCVVINLKTKFKVIYSIERLLLRNDGKICTKIWHVINTHLVPELEAV